MERERQKFLEGVRGTAERFGMDLSRALALVSGGPDSVALLRALVALGYRPVVLHVDHGLRGEESREDAAFVRKLCEELELMCEVRTLELGGPNLQAEAREARYRVAEEVAARRGLEALATGHTADDVAETVLLNLARGAGLRGLAGIPPVRGWVVRPLIRATRRDVLAFLESLGQPYRTDTSNLTGKYARNRVRLEVLPVLEDLYPGAAANVARAAELLRADLEALEETAARVVRRRGEEVVVPLPELLDLPPGLRRHALRRAYAELLPGERPLPSVAVGAVLALLGGEGTRTVDLPGAAVAAVRGSREVAFYKRPDGRAKATPAEQGLTPGVAEFAGWGFEVREVAAFDPRDAARPEVVYLDAGEGPYRVRAAREGDTIRPLGLGGTKKVLRAMMDRKVPADTRRRTPVIVGRWGRVAWVFCGEMDERFGVGEKTEKILRLEVLERP